MILVPIREKKSKTGIPIFSLLAIYMRTRHTFTTFKKKCLADDTAERA
jgi:hypothetical protein